MDASESEVLPQYEEAEPFERVIWQIGGPSSHPLSVHMQVDRASLQIKVDMGATVSLISRETRKKLFP